MWNYLQPGGKLEEECVLELLLGLMQDASTAGVASRRALALAAERLEPESPRRFKSATMCWWRSLVGLRIFDVGWTTGIICVRGARVCGRGQRVETACAGACSEDASVLRRMPDCHSQVWND